MTIHLSTIQKQALQAAISHAILPAGQGAKYSAARTGATIVARVTLEALERRKLVEPSRFDVFHFVATHRGRKTGRAIGLSTTPSIHAPATLRERAIILRELTMPDVWACGQKDADYPRKVPFYPGHALRWIEHQGYGRFEPTTGQYPALHLVLTAKGQRLVSATDAPITVRLGREMVQSLKRGQLRQVMVPDPGPDRLRLANFQLLATDHMGSASDIWARLYDPAAIFPGTRLNLVDAKSGRRIATARAGEWDRIWFRANESYGHPIFDVNYEYSRYSALDQYSRRIWVAFPHDRGEFAPGPEAHAFARDCGFDNLNRMRSFWLRRSPPENSGCASNAGRKKDFYGLLIELHDIDLGSFHSTRASRRGQAGTRGVKAPIAPATGGSGFAALTKAA